MTTSPGATPRSVATQSLEQLGGSGSILVEQRLDHAVLDQLMTEAAEAASPYDYVDAVSELATRALQHAFAEETVLLPACRNHLGVEGDAWTVEAEARHQQINELLASTADAPVDADTNAAFAEACALIRADAREEEDELLPRLQAVLDQDALRALGTAWLAARVAAPIRPYPRISRPPQHVLAAPALPGALRGPAAPEPQPETAVTPALHAVATAAPAPQPSTAAPAPQPRTGDSRTVALVAGAAVVALLAAWRRAHHG